ncbi:ArsR/SmtB family transcription factor [Alkalibacillus haloalkaliphilus]|uniref:ArsR/SmtB family transcription factor n=1 Tax=Alkalibacillus haloalkaliphilus TaxID=94136 RepID=UPI0029356F38|nr:metalloregulator ArsR/SmtB family transcription factor [Alkalibacillus haloalkaliphilus]MDV2583058.1 metalloregulator ArsR/SmtB family transcription factor [Alkalibacillus haloalkaliphilus]
MTIQKKVTTDELSNVLKLLGEKTRLTIMQSVYVQELCVCELVELLDMSQPAISQHLRKLRDAKLVQEKRKGNWIYYKVNHDHPIYHVVEMIINELPSMENELKELEKQNLLCE